MESTTTRSMLEVEMDEFGFCARSRAVVVSDDTDETVSAGEWRYPRGESAETYATRQATVTRGIPIPARR